MSARRAERAYTLLLRAYPPAFRAAFGREMTLCFRDLVRDAGAPGFGFWMTIVGDVARSAPRLHADALRARWNRNVRAEEGRMKPMGILAVMIGLFQAINAFVELGAGRGSHDTVERVAVLAFVATGLLLVVAGVAMLQRARRAKILSQIAAVSWLVLVVLVRVIYPWMSTLSVLLAVVFPIALLVYVWRIRGSSKPTVA